MVCFFCSSSRHSSEECDDCVTDDSRKEVLRLSSCCELCTEYLPSGMNHKEKSCKKQQKCYTCFAKNHHTLFCPGRFDAPKKFFPNLDFDLHSRFIQTLLPKEQYPTAFLSPNAAKFIHLKPHIIAQGATKYNIYQYPDSVFIVKDFINFFKTNFIKEPNHFVTILSDTIIIDIARIYLKKCTHIPFQFFQFLSPNITVLELSDSSFVSNPTFTDIIKNVPNIIELSVHGSSIKIEKTWAEDLLKYKNGKDFIKLEIGSLKFENGILAQFITEKCTDFAKIILYYRGSPYNFHDWAEVDEKLSSHFIPQIVHQNGFPYIYLQDIDNLDVEPQRYRLK